MFNLNSRDDAPSFPDVEYATIHNPGIHRLRPHCPLAHFMISLSDSRGRDLSAALPEMLVPDPSDDEDDDGTVLIRTNGRFPYPLNVRIIPA